MALTVEDPAVEAQVGQIMLVTMEPGQVSDNNKLVSLE